MSIRFLGFLVLFAGCSSGESAPPPGPAESVDPGPLPTLRIFFGHQSVGRDILAGISELAPAVRIAPVGGRPDVGGALIEASLGRNQHPGTKDRAFLEALDAVGPVDLALYKYCYLDVDTDTDPDSLFADYSATLEEARSRGVRTLPVTVPVTAAEPAWKRWVKGVVGRPTETARNERRMRFNERLRAHYEGQAIVDLARMESTREDGSRCLVDVDGRPVEVLAPAYTSDGGHLNERGRRQVARGFLAALVSGAP